VIKKQIECFFFTKFGDRGYCYPQGDNSVSSGSNKNNIAVSPAGRETLGENVWLQRSTVKMLNYKTLKSLLFYCMSKLHEI
jgi:hypothetical protein